MKLVYPAVVLSQAPDGFHVRFPDLDEALTEGQTLDEALYNASEVLSLALEHRLEKGRELPLPSPVGEGQHEVAPAAAVQSAMLVRLAREGRSLADLARALETSWGSAQRLENPKHSPSLRQLERAASALGKRLVLAFE